MAHTAPGHRKARRIRPAVIAGLIVCAVLAAAAVIVAML